MVRNKQKVSTDHTNKIGIEQSIGGVTFCYATSLAVEFNSAPLPINWKTLNFTSLRDTAVTCITRQLKTIVNLYNGQGVDSSSKYIQQC